MAFEPENPEQEQSAPETTLSQPETGQMQVPQDLLEKISSQLSGLAEQVQELKSEVSTLRAENSALREQPAPAKSEEKGQSPDEGVWKSYSKAEFATDFENAMENMDEVDWHDGPPEDSSKWPDQEPFITKEMLGDMEDEFGDMMAEIASFNTENPSDYIQDDPTASTGLPTPDVSETPAEQEAPADESGGSNLDDDAIQQMLSATEEGSTEVVAEEATAEPETEAASEEDTSEVSDEEIQALLAQPADSEEAAAEEGPPEPEEPEEEQAEEPAEADEGGEDAQVEMSEDEIASLMAEADEIASEADPVTPTKPPARTSAEDDETVEVGFTAFQAGKKVDGDLSSEPGEDAQEEEPEEVVERREVVEVSFEVDMDAVKKVPAHLAIAALAVPVSVSEEGLVCKVVTPIDRSSIDLIEDAVAMQVVVEPAPMDEVLDALRKAYGASSLWCEREAVMEVAPKSYKPKKGKRKNFFGRAA